MKPADRERKRKIKHKENSYPQNSKTKKSLPSISHSCELISICMGNCLTSSQDFYLSSKDLALSSSITPENLEISQYDRTMLNEGVETPLRSEQLLRKRKRCSSRLREEADQTAGVESCSKHSDVCLPL